MMMKKKIYTIAVALAAVFLATAPAAEASDRPRKEEKSKVKLKEENQKLREQLDSMKIELEKYRAEFEYAEMSDEETYPENEEVTAEEIAPEDYTAEVSDSPLNIWYAHMMASDEEMETFDMDSVKFQSNVPDEVYIERIKKMNSFIALPYNDIVKNYIILYSEKMPTKMAHIMGLCQYYMPIFEETFNRYEIPEELKAMAVIESAMNPLAVSRAGAKGMWQFMYSTAKMYGLNIDSFVDERLDPVKSADAAARYLKDA